MEKKNGESMSAYLEPIMVWSVLQHPLRTSERGTVSNSLLDISAPGSGVIIGFGDLGAHSCIWPSATFLTFPRPSEP